MSSQIVVVAMLFSALQGSSGRLDRETYETIAPFRECLSKKHPGLCLKEAAVQALDVTMRSSKPFNLLDVVDVETNPAYLFTADNATDLPEEATARSAQLTDILYDKVREFFESRTFKISMTPGVEEGRKKRRRGGMMMLGMLGMAAMVGQIFMGKIAFMAGTALILAKIAFLTSAIMGLKKLSSGGGSKESHVVYTEGHSHGGGGWQRNWGNSDAQNLAYKAQISDAAGY